MWSVAARATEGTVLLRQLAARTGGPDSPGRGEFLDFLMLLSGMARVTRLAALAVASARFAVVRVAQQPFSLKEHRGSAIYLIIAQLH